MRKKVVLLGSISIAIVCVVLVITSMSAIAGNVWSDGKIEPQPPVPRIERIDEPNYQV
ncbi:MAG: hypothetical protein GWN61_07575, partial [candidate division Zixibacteria bacterium]|nr:hypothetical protein [candidate division Zixibacteria bacterium]NIW44829.1 hypothetical protein [Gammaproteobacteria bacterium]NIR63945.1 hypothetical protein [candidate division Zixibacteria bacterium]NIS45865.1 hypothetical protein [candidate division Zixibacteria bacterium]NIU13998.1 hypothetical protein [candidate division Zixibacteria bacterium]